MNSHFNGSLGVIFAVGLLCGCGPAVPETPVAEKDIPYTKHLVMKKDDAQKFQLPNGKVVTVWCERPDFPTVGEQATASGLKTAWGERPFVRPELIMKRQPDGSQVASGWKSYIEQGSVITYGSTKTTEYILYVDKWQFSIIEDLAAKGDLPVTIKIVPRPSP